MGTYRHPYQPQQMQNARSYIGCLPRFCTNLCGAAIRLFLLAVLIVNLGLATSIIINYSTVNGITVSNTAAPGTIIFSEVICAITLAWLLLSFCLMGAPVILLVGDAISFVGWFAASAILGVSLNQILQYSCEEIAVTVGAQSGLGFGRALGTYGTGLGYGGLGSYGTGIGAGTFGSQGLEQESLAQQIFNSCNITKTLFSFHVIATAFFIGVAISAAISVSLGGRNKSSPRVNQQNNYFNAGQRGIGSYEPRSMRSGPVPNVPEIVV